jgi:Flp pilus assembly protein CpaB
MVVAFLLAVGATTAIFLYVQGVKRQAKPSANFVTVIVAKKDISPETRLDPLIQEGQFTTLSVPRDALVAGAVTALSDLSGQTTATFILKGEQISRARLQGSSISPDRLGTRPGYEAVTLQLDQQRVVSGFLQATDHVVLYTTLDNKAGVSFTATLVPDVRVLKVGSSSGGSSGGTNLITLELKPADAAKVILAQEEGHVWLALLPPNQQGLPLPPVTISQLAK